MLDHSQLDRNLLNSALEAGSATGLAGRTWRLVRLRGSLPADRGKAVVLGLALSISMCPPIAAISPLCLLVRELGLRDTLAALILTRATFALPLAVWILAGVFRQIPVELYWAARMDGCGPARTGLGHPAADSAGRRDGGSVVFISWNEFMFALTLTASDASRTAPVAIALFPGLHETPWGEMAATTTSSRHPSPCSRWFSNTWSWLVSQRAASRDEGCLTPRGNGL